MLRDGSDFQVRLTLPSFNASATETGSAAEPSKTADSAASETPAGHDSSLLPPRLSLMDSKLTLDPALESMVLGQAPAPTLSVAFPNVDSLSPGGLLAPVPGMSLETQMAMVRAQIDPLGSLAQPTLPIFEREPNQDLEALKNVLSEISPELAELVNQGSDSGQAAPLLDQNINYTLGQLLLSFDTAPDGLQQNFCAALDRVFAGGSPSPDDLRLLASYHISVKQGRLFDNLRQQPVATQDQLELLKVNLSSRRLDVFDHVLSQIRQGQTLTPEEQDLLAAYGLHAKRGELVNLVDGKPLSAAQVDLISRLVATLDGSLASTRSMLQQGSLSKLPKISLHGGSDAPVGMKLEQTYIRRQLTDRLNSLSPMLRKEFGSHKEIEATIEINRRKQEATANKLEAQDQANLDLADKLETAKEQESHLAQEALDLEAAESWAASLPPGVSLHEAWLALPEERRAKLQPALERLSLAYPDRDGVLRFSLSQGRPANSDNLSDLLRSRREGYHKRTVELRNQVQTLQIELERGREASRRLRQEIEQLRLEQAQQFSALAASDALIAGASNELAALKADPAKWALLSLEQQREAEELLAGSSEALANSKRLYERQRETDLKVNAILAASLAQEPRLDAAADLGRLLIANLDRQIAKSLSQFDKLAALEAKQAPVSAAARRLISAADALEAKVSLTAKPFYVGLDKLLDAWGEIMRSARASFDQQFGQVLAEEALARQFDASHARQLKESLDYHLARIDAGKQLSQEQLKHWLSTSLELLRKQLAPIA